MADADVRTILDRFERAWLDEECPEIADYLSDAPSASAGLLRALVNVDLEYRLKSGLNVRVESYLESYPLLGTNTETVLELIEVECRLRQRRTPESLLDEYRQRFPELSDELSDRLPEPVVEPAEAQDTTMLLDATPDDDQSASDICSAGSRKPSPAGRRLGKFELIEEVGQGGMGIVYRARQVSLDRIVAVKRLHAKALASPRQVKQFESEAKSISRLRHCNIVSVLEYGSDGGEYYLAMDFVDGRVLADAARESPWENRRTARLVARLAQAIQHAHEQGVLHCDLKPSNVIVDGDDQPHIVDFGIAKRRPSADDSTELMTTGQPRGTAPYIPPESLEGGTFQETGDVYGLGAILYETLTGLAPFRAATRADTIFQVRHVDVVEPRQLNSRIDRDLETICLKCLQKVPSRRYGSAGELAADLQRYLDHKPIQARPIGTVERVCRWARRNPRDAARTAFVIWTLLLVAVVSSVMAYKLNRSRQENRNLAARNLMEAGVDDCRQGRRRQGVMRFARAFQTAETSSKVRQDAYRLLKLWSHGLDKAWPHNAEVRDVVFSPDGTRLAAICEDGNIAMWDVPGGSSPRNWKGHSALIQSAAFSDDGRLLATAGDDGAVRIWDAATGQPSGGPLEHEGVFQVAFLDSDLVMTGGLDGWLRIRNVHDGRIFARMNSDGPVQCWAIGKHRKRVLVGCRNGMSQLWDIERHEKIRDLTTSGPSVSCVALSADRRWALVATYDRNVHLWELEQENSARTIKVGYTITTAVDFNPESTRYLVAGRDQTLRLYGLDNHQADPIYDYEHDDAILDARFSPDGKFIATCSEDRTALIHDVDKRRIAGEPIRHEHYISRVRFSSDGNYVASAGLDKVVCLRGLGGRRPASVLRHDDEVWVTAVLPSTDYSPARVLTASRDRTAALWNDDGDLIAKRAFNDWVLCGCFSDDGRFLVVGSMDGTVEILDAQTGDLLHSLAHRPAGRLAQPVERSGASHRPPAEGFEIVAVACSPDSQTVATLTYDGSVRLWDATNGRLRTESPLPFPLGASRGYMRQDFAWSGYPSHCEVRFHPQGTHVMACHPSQGVHVWQTAQLDIPAVRLHAEDALPVVLWQDAVFSPDGKRVAVAEHRFLRIWDAADGWKQHSVLVQPLHTATHALAFSPDSSRLASASTDGTVYLWDLAGRSLWAEPLRHGHGTHVRGVAFSPDGRALVSTDLMGSVRLWDAFTGHPLGPGFRHDGAVVALAVSNCGRRMVTGSADGTARVWPLPGSPNPTLNNVDVWVGRVTGMTWDAQRNRPRLLSVLEWQKLSRSSDEPLQ